MAKAAAAQATVTLKHLAAALAETHEMAKKQSELILNDLVDLVTKHCSHGKDRFALDSPVCHSVRSAP
jgi:DNA-binding protein HU-beta